MQHSTANSTQNSYKRKHQVLNLTANSNYYDISISNTVPSKFLYIFLMFLLNVEMGKKVEECCT